MTPRAIAAMICKQTTREARAHMLMQVPDDMRPLVKKHVEIYFDRRSHERNRAK